MGDLRPPKKSLRQIPKLAILRKGTPSPELRAPVPLRMGPVGRIVIGAGGTALFITCLYSAYSPASVGDITATIVMLLSGWVFAVGAFTLSELLSSLSNRHRYLASFSFAIVCAAVTAIWGVTIFHPAAPTIQKTGARMFFTVAGFAKDSKKIDVTMTNHGDVMARAGSLYGSVVSVVDHALSEKEENERYKLALSYLPPMGSGTEIPVNVPRLMQIDINLTEAQYDGINNGTLHFYLFVVTAFKDELTLSGKLNLATMCTHFTKNTTTGLVCIGHSESRYTN
jgi:hypothetical protein